MNSNTQYEITIAQKLQQLPLPDMADLIWERVERQLDIDMPTNDGGVGGTNTPSGGGWISGGALGLFAIAFVLVFMLLKKEKTKSPSFTFPQENSVITQPADKPTGGNGPTKNIRSLPGSSKINTDSPGQIFIPTSGVDSALTIEPLLLPDTAHRNTTTIPTSKQVRDSIIQKPGRGVRGISDNDYRITPVVKDST